MMHFFVSHRAFLVSISSISEPKTFKRVVLDSNWRYAMAAEIKAIEANHTWTLTPLHAHKEPIGCKPVYKRSNTNLMTILKGTKLDWLLKVIAKRRDLTILRLLHQSPNLLMFAVFLQLQRHRIGIYINSMLIMFFFMVISMSR